MPLWNSRFRKSLAESALRYSSSIDFDKRLFNEDIDGSKAHVKMLVRQRIIPAADGKAIVAALEEIRKEIASGTLNPDWRREDIHTVIEERLVEKVGEKGKRLHSGRSRNDQVALDERLYLRNAVSELIAAVKSVQKSLVRQAEQHRSTIVPGYTHMQRAQPILFAHHLLAYVAMLDRDAGRLADSRKRIEMSPLGAAAFAGSTLPLDRKQVAKVLEFDGIVENSIDAVSDRDVLLEVISACAIIMMHLSRLAEEVVLWSSQEFRFASVDDAYATGSSLMPQKKNPDMAELVRGKTGRVYGALVGLLTVMKALPLAYNRDMQEDKVHLFSAIETTEQSLQITAEMIETISFDAARYEKELEGDLSLATDLADYLVQKGIPFRQAHEIVGRIVQHCVEHEIKLTALTHEQFGEFSPAFGAEVPGMLSVQSSIGRKRTAGSSSPAEVAKQIRNWKRKLQLL